ncbi:uncharacterized protein LOC119453992 [Dermacentor silvarum]|uniref:uncharacterized protein LOC119453992 n=1 Tax=Dermacentor silvarum TaxID=543639 RepID=UPI00210156C2|nr:uncharacterized protein LOC119453992 [Dermacentor silvarum]
MHVYFYRIHWTASDFSQKGSENLSTRNDPPVPRQVTLSSLVMIITSPTQPQYSTVQSERIFLTSRLTSQIAASEDTTAATDLTYRQMNATSTAGMPESSVKITVADTATDSTSTARTAPPRPILDPQTLLCTYGTRTNQSTLFPDDGLCDLIFFDSVYKENQNSLWATAIFSGNLRKMLDVTSNYRSTEFGVAFAYQ